MPPSLRNEVKDIMMNSIIDRLPFFKDKNSEFQYRVLPLLKAKKLYQGDILYSEGDTADEITFIISGSVTLYQDISDLIELPEKLIDIEKDAFNVPFTLYRTGSYFGDEDVLLTDARPGIDDEKID